MKKIATPLIITITLLSSCQKADQYLKTELIKGKHADDYIKATAEIRPCALTQIVYTTKLNSTDVLQFTYNSYGDPVSIARQSGGHTGYPNYAFKYDGSQRLTDFVGPYDGNATAEFWHKYFYDGKGNIVLDSAYIFPHIENGFPQKAYSSQATFYTYDDWDRIIKDSTSFSNSSQATVHRYAYDSYGNKVGSSYDNGININRTNKIWMFLNRDYSVNNPFKADSYNAEKLPLSFSLPANGGAFNFLENVYPKAQIVYACDGQVNQ